MAATETGVAAGQAQDTVAQAGPAQTDSLQFVSAAVNVVRVNGVVGCKLDCSIYSMPRDVVTLLAEHQTLKGYIERELTAEDIARMEAGSNPSWSDADSDMMSMIGEGDVTPDEVAISLHDLVLSEVGESVIGDKNFDQFNDCCGDFVPRCRCKLLADKMSIIDTSPTINASPLTIGDIQSFMQTDESDCEPCDTCSSLEQPVNSISPLLAYESSQQQISAAAGSMLRPPGLLLDDADYVPALSDNGASRGCGCVRTLDGAILSTFIAADAGYIAVGNNAGGLHSEGSYVYMFERYGADGSGDVVLRRMKHTPDLRVPVVFSEATEIYDHGYEFTSSRAAGRVVKLVDGSTVKLFLNKSKLGWWKVRPVTNKTHAAMWLANMQRGSVSRPLLPDHSAMLPYTLPPSSLAQMRSSHQSVNFFRPVEINDGFVQAPLGSDNLIESPRSRSAPTA